MMNKHHITDILECMSDDDCLCYLSEDDHWSCCDIFAGR